MNSFLLGSRVYGTPNPNSDWDLAVLIGRSDLDALRTEFADNLGGSAVDETQASFRLGNLNLLCFTCPVVFDAWRQATKELTARRPVTRGEAIRLIDQFQFSVRSDARDFRKVAMGHLPSFTKENPVAVTVSLFELVRLEGTRPLWPRDFDGRVAFIEDNPGERTAWGVVADWLDENDEPQLAAAFRWVMNHPEVTVRRKAGGIWVFDGLPHALYPYYSDLFADVGTLAGAAACLAVALERARKDLS